MASSSAPVAPADFAHAWKAADPVSDDDSADGGDDGGRASPQVRASSLSLDERLDARRSPKPAPPTPELDLPAIERAVRETVRDALKEFSPPPPQPPPIGVR